MNALDIKAHEAADLFPMLADDRLAELAADIRENGLREPIRLLDGRIIDGRNRYRACQMAAITPHFEHVAQDINPWALVWSLNGQRRDLSRDQRYILWDECNAKDAEWQATQRRIREEANRKRAEAARERERNADGTLAPTVKATSAATTCGTTGAAPTQAGPAPRLTTTAVARAPEPKPEAKPIRGAEEKAKAANVDRGTVDRNDFLKRNRPDLHQKVKVGELTSSRAYTQAKKDAQIVKLTDTAAQEAKAAQGVYDVVVLDPPWPMEKIEREVRPNQAAFDYPTMTEAELAAMPIPAADDCHVWVWTTHKFMPMALRLLDAWGLKYVCTFVWHKPGGFQPIGLPQYNCEFALYARKGSPRFIDTKAFPTCFQAPRGAHSEKPGEFYDVVRRVTAGRRLDMFNRRRIDGFDGWGKEAAE